MRVCLHIQVYAHAQTMAYAVVISQTPHPMAVLALLLVEKALLISGVFCAQCVVVLFLCDVQFSRVERVSWTG